MTSQRMSAINTLSFTLLLSRHKSHIHFTLLKYFDNFEGPFYANNNECMNEYHLHSWHCKQNQEKNLASQVNVIKYHAQTKTNSGLNCIILTLWNSHEPSAFLYSSSKSLPVTDYKRQYYVNHSIFSKDNLRRKDAHQTELLPWNIGCNLIGNWSILFVAILMVKDVSLQN